MAFDRFSRYVWILVTPRMFNDKCRKLLSHNGVTFFAEVAIGRNIKVLRIVLNEDWAEVQIRDFELSTYFRYNSLWFRGVL